MAMKKIGRVILAVLGSDAFAVCAGLALVYGYIKASLEFMEYMAR